MKDKSSQKEDAHAPGSKVPRILFLTAFTIDFLRFEVRLDSKKRQYFETRLVWVTTPKKSPTGRYPDFCYRYFKPTIYPLPRTLPSLPGQQSFRPKAKYLPIMP